MARKMVERPFFAIFLLFQPAFWQGRRKWFQIMEKKTRMPSLLSSFLFFSAFFFLFTLSTLFESFCFFLFLCFSSQVFVSGSSYKFQRGIRKCNIFHWLSPEIKMRRSKSGLIRVTGLIFVVIDTWPSIFNQKEGGCWIMIRI